MRLRARNASWVGLIGVAIAIGLCLAVLVGCGGKSATVGGGDAEARIATQVIQIAPVDDWDPAIGYGYTLSNVYETLLRYTPESNSFEPVLATDYSVSDDGLTWTFEIRKGVKFHDGTELNAEAVKFSIDRTIKMGKSYAYIWSSVKNIETPEPYTVVFNLSYPAPIDLISAAGFAAYIISPTAVTSHPDGWLNDGHEAGTGAYMLKSQNPGSQVVLERYPDYWRGWEGRHFDVVIIKTVTEPAGRRLMLEKGDADFTEELTLQDLKALKDNPEVRLVMGKAFENLTLHLNTLKPPLDKVAVRQALSYAFPYEDAVEYAAGGYATQARGIVPAGLCGHDDSLFQYTYDLEKAKRLLASAGFPDGGFKLLMTYTSGDEAEKVVGQLYKEALAKLNIELELRSLPWEGQMALARATNPLKRQDMTAMYWWPSVCSAAGYMKGMLRSEDTPVYDLSYYKNPKLDRLIDEGDSMMAVDRTKAASIFSQAQAIAVEDAPVIYIYDRQAIFGVYKSFGGYVYNAAYSRDVKFYNTYRN